MEIERPHDCASAKQTRVFSVLNGRERDAVSRHWEVALAFIVHAPLDPRILERAFRLAIERFVEARSTFRVVGGVLRVETLATSQFCLSGAPTRPQSRPDALAMARADAWRGFRSLQEPLVALRMYPQDDGTTLLTLQLSHLVADGAAIEMLINHIMFAYLAGGADLPPPAENFTFADYVDWEERFLASEACAIQESFWRARTPSSFTAPLPYDRPASGEMVEAGAVLRFETTAIQTERIAARTRTLATTPFAVLLTGVTRAAARWSGKADLSLGCAFARRHRREFVNLFGDLAGGYPIDCAIANAIAPDLAIRAVSAQIQDMAQHQDYPIFALDPDWRLLGSAPAQGNPGFPQVSFGSVSTLRPEALGMSGLMHSPEGTRISVANIAAESVSLETRTCGRDIAIVYVPRQNSITLSVVYDAGRFDQTTVASLGAEISEELSAC